MNSREQVTTAFSGPAASTLGFYSPVSDFETDRIPIQANEWASSDGKRAFDLLIAAVLMLISLPFTLLIAVSVKLTSRGPVLFRQERVGRGGTTFLMWKFRTMRTDLSGGPSVTKMGDVRFTPVGGFLRRFKLDELPQLVNVIRGQMSLVGPRPKVPHHETQTLRYRPGVTGAASLAFRREEELLHQVPESLLDDYQVRVMMPVKRRLDDSYMRRSTLRSDLQLMIKTVLGRGDLIQRSDLFQRHHSLTSLSSEWTGADASLGAAECRYEEANAA